MSNPLQVNQSSLREDRYLQLMCISGIW